MLFILLGWEARAKSRIRESVILERFQKTVWFFSLAPFAPATFLVSLCVTTHENHRDRNS